MKASCGAAVARFLASGLAIAPGVQAIYYGAITAQQQIAMFNAEDFAYSLGGPEPSDLVEGVQFRGATLNQLPSLAGQGIAMVLVNLDACAISLPHIHPRATEMLYTIEGNRLRVAFVEEVGGEGAVVNELAAGDVAFFPQGLIHYQQNLDCEPATFLVALNSEDPGVVAVPTLFFELPNEAIQASLNIEDPTLLALIESLPDTPATARLDCLASCGLLDDDDDDDDDVSYNHDYDSVDN